MPFNVPVPENSMKLNGVTGDVEPGGIPATFPQSTVVITVPWNFNFRSCATSVHWPPWPAVEEQPGKTLPPKECSGVLPVPTVPPPVSQHPPLVTGWHSGLLI